MNKQKHTPTYTYDGNENETYFVFKDGAKFLEVFGSEDGAIEVTGLLNDLPCSNHAPELLKALENLEDVISGLEADYDSGRKEKPSDTDILELRDAWRKAELIINKAKGL